MPTFQYSARAISGDLRTGEIDLPTKDEVVGYLRKQRMVPVSVRTKPKEFSLSFGSGVSMREV